MPKRRKNLWILEDCDAVLWTYREYFQKTYNLTEFQTIGALDKALSSGQRPDLLVADLNLPDGNFLQYMTKATLDEELKIIVVSDIEDCLTLSFSLQSRVLDYVLKPFSMTLLGEKIKRALRSRVCEVCFTTMTAKAFGKTSEQLTPKEAQIVSLLSDGKPVTKETLLSKIWPKVNVSQSTLNVHLFGARRKISLIGLTIHLDNSGLYWLSG